jgi:rare lipoprotein A
MKMRRLIPLVTFTLLLAACASTSKKHDGGYLSGDGPGASTPSNLDAIPDAVPRAEPLSRAASRPYTALGKTYTPLTQVGQYKMRGIASWYGKKFHGQHTANGEIYDMYAMTAAHPTLPIPSYARVTNLSNRKSVVVRINDRGPFMYDRIIDLSYTAAYKLGIIGKGSSEVEVESLPPGADTQPLIAAAPIQSAPLPPVATPVAVAPPVPEIPPPVGSAYLQLGAFKSEQGAQSFLAKLRDEFGLDGAKLNLYRKDDLTRVYLGPYASADEARADAGKLQSQLGFKPVVNSY